MPAKLPYLASPGLIDKVLASVQQARRPRRFTPDFVQGGLGLAGAGARAVIPFLARLGLLHGDGTPTPAYDGLRNPAARGAVVAAALRRAYGELYARCEGAHELPREQLAALVAEVTGAQRGDSTTKCIVGSFRRLTRYADFAALARQATDRRSGADPVRSDASGGETGVVYTINLNLPETTDPRVFDAIFKSLKEHLLAG